jgi:hypothetical protein
MIEITISYKIQQWLFSLLEATKENIFLTLFFFPPVLIIVIVTVPFLALAAVVEFMSIWLPIAIILNCIYEIIKILKNVYFLSFVVFFMLLFLLKEFFS